MSFTVRVLGGGKPMNNSELREYGFTEEEIRRINLIRQFRSGFLTESLVNEIVIQGKEIDGIVSGNLNRNQQRIIA